MMTTIAARVVALQTELPPQVLLVAVSKYAPIEAMRAAYAAGIRHFGESKVQEALTKKAALQDLPGITWHLIGHLQRNKVRQALQIFDWIHALDRLELALLIDRLIGAGERSPQLCLQVKLAPDPDKYGWTPTELSAAISTLSQCRNLAIVGMMTILPQGVLGEAAFQLFGQIYPLRAQLQAQGFNLPHLSMGMSQDYKEAIRAGATIVRVGSKLFM